MYDEFAHDEFVMGDEEEEVEAPEELDDDELEGDDLPETDEDEEL